MLQPCDLGTTLPPVCAGAAEEVLLLCRDKRVIAQLMAVVAVRGFGVPFIIPALKTLVVSLNHGGPAQAYARTTQPLITAHMPAPIKTKYTRTMHPAAPPPACAPAIGFVMTVPLDVCPA